MSNDLKKENAALKARIKELEENSKLKEKLAKAEAEEAKKGLLELDKRAKELTASVYPQVKQYLIKPEYVERDFSSPLTYSGYSNEGSPDDARLKTVLNDLVSDAVLDGLLSEGRLPYWLMAKQ